MDEFNHNIKQLKIIKETLERQRNENLNYLIKMNSPENKLKELQKTIEFIGNPTKQSYEYLLNQRKDFVSELNKTVDNLERMRNSTKIILPIDYIKGIHPSQSQYEKILNSINRINWFDVRDSIDKIIGLKNYYINIFFPSDEFSDAIYEHVQTINDDKLNKIFTIDFLKKITMNWWIFPRFSLDEYKEISKIKDVNSFNNFILDKYFFNPELIGELIDNWNIANDIRKNIINQAYFNYLNGNYETCVIILMLQIEGIMKETIDYKKNDSKLRIKIQNKLNDSIDNKDSWKSFLNKANSEFLSKILQPLYQYSDFEYSTGDINRHEIAHLGYVDCGQIGALRLFFILDTVMYILEDLDLIN